MKRMLNDMQIRNAGIGGDGKPKKYTDGEGMYLLESRVGKYWRYNYRFNKKGKLWF